MRLLLLSLLLLLCVSTVSGSASWDPTDPPIRASPSLVMPYNNNDEDGMEHMTHEKQIEALRLEAKLLDADCSEYRETWHEILSLDSHDLEAHLQLGWALVRLSLQNKLTEDPSLFEYGLSLLQEAFDETQVSPVIDVDFNPQTVMFSALIGRYRADHRKQTYALALKFLEQTVEIEQKHHKNVAKQYQDPYCVQLQLATLLDASPLTEVDANEAIEVMTEWSQSWLRQEAAPIVDMGAIRTIMLDQEIRDPYTHCMLNTYMHLKMYDRAPVAELAGLHYEIALAMWPDLHYVSPHVDKYESQVLKDIAMGKQQQCVPRKIKLAVICSSTSETGPDALDFGGVLQRLDRSWAFSVTYIYLHDPGYTLGMEPQGPPANFTLANFTRIHECSDLVWLWMHPPPDTAAEGVLDAAWTSSAWKLGPLANEDFDMALFLDLTKHTYARRLGMQRIAPVQFTTHGGNMALSSGHPSNIIQYYVSWAAAEQTREVSEQHYSENLLLLPRTHMHLYYEPNIIEQDDGTFVSRLDGKPFKHLSLIEAGLTINSNIRIDPSRDQNLYLVLHPRFHPGWDTPLCEIMQKDQDAYLMFHKPTGIASAQDVFEMRLEVAGCDLGRILFWDSQRVTHSQRLAMYRHAVVVLDTYPAEATVSIRDVLEMHRPIVTLPGRLLGGRWTYGYYQALGLSSETMSAVIAKNADDYVRKAVALATDAEFRKVILEDFARNVPENLFREQRAVEVWQNLLLAESPVQPCRPEKKPDCRDTGECDS